VLVCVASCNCICQCTYPCAYCIPITHRRGRGTRIVSCLQCQFECDMNVTLVAVFYVLPMCADVRCCCHMCLLISSQSPIYSLPSLRAAFHAGVLFPFVWCVSSACCVCVDSVVPILRGLLRVSCTGTVLWPFVSVGL